MSSLDVSAYRPIFYPQSIAVIGASGSMMKFGGMFLRTILNHGFKGSIYPVNPKSGDIMGLKTFPTVEAIPAGIDLAVITVPAEHVPEALQSCIKKGIKGAEILTAGFREAGLEGEELEWKILRLAREGGIRLIGPNCFGVYSPAVGLTLMPGVDFSTVPGAVGFFSQSGGGTCDVAYMAAGRGVHFSVAVSYGNGCDIEAEEMLDYFAADPATKIVGAYIEGVRDGRSFFDALKGCARCKPVVIYKGGLSEQGQRGTLGHTGSLAGSKTGWDAAIKSAGAVPARDAHDLVECLMAFNCLENFTARRVGILAGGGMRCVESLDAASKYGFEAPALDEAAFIRIHSLLPPVGSRAANPVDLANPVMAPLVINTIMEELARMDRVEFLLLYQMLFYLLNESRRMKMISGNPGFTLEYHKDITDIAEKIRYKTGKPLVVILPDLASDPEHAENEIGRREARNYYTGHGIPCFDSAFQAFSVLRRVADYYMRTKSKNTED